jgi:hypothetical protein
MRFSIYPLAEYLRKHRRRAATVAASGFLVLSLGVLFPLQTREAGHTLLCSARTNPCDQALARRLFDSHCRPVRVDRIVSGALRFASSL